jgi:hypothetical protein
MPFFLCYAVVTSGDCELGIAIVINLADQVSSNAEKYLGYCVRAMWTKTQFLGQVYRRYLIFTFHL